MFRSVNSDPWSPVYEFIMSKQNKTIKNHSYTQKNENSKRNSKPVQTSNFQIQTGLKNFVSQTGCILLVQTSWSKSQTSCPDRLSRLLGAQTTCMSGQKHDNSRKIYYWQIAAWLVHQFHETTCLYFSQYLCLIINISLSKFCDFRF